ATVLPRGRVHGDKSAREQRGQNSVLVPVAIVLVPCPCAANLRVFHDHFRMVVVHLTAQQLFRRVDEGLTSREHPIQCVAGMVPEREANSPAFSVSSVKGMLIEFPILPGGTPQQADFIFIEHSSHQDKPVSLVFPQLVIVEGALRHKHTSLCNCCLQSSLVEARIPLSIYLTAWFCSGPS